MTTSQAAMDSFLQVWKAAFAKVLTQLGASEVTVPDTDPEHLKRAIPEDSAVLEVRFTGGGCLKGQLQWSAGKSVAVQCAQLLMSEPVDAATEFSATHLDGYLEFLRQVAGEVAVAWKAIQSSPVKLVHLPESNGAFPSQAAVGLSLESDKCKALALRLDLDAEMVASVSAPLETAASEESSVEDTAESGANRNLPSNLNLILDVQLDATIRFGEREMLLKDVFALMPGAVVELDQLVNEPAELLVAGRLVATGEVVVVDGNFGLRVKEVLSPAQRVMALSLG
jgi:flagellar motor switch protein FliN